MSFLTPRYKARHVPVALRTLLASVSAACVFVGTLDAAAQTAVTTQNYDISRTGQNTTETVLTPTVLQSGNFGKLSTLTFDGQVLAQPLYLPAVTIGGVAHQTLFVATEHDSVYAVDAASGATLWHASLVDTAHGAASGATPDPQSDTGCGDISAFAPAAGEYGVSSTPVIDPTTGTLYVEAKSYENGAPVHRLHALDITSGAEKLGGPATIAATVAGTGVDSSNGVLKFDSKWQHQRTGLLLVNGVIYLGFGSHCDTTPWHGWLLGYDATTLAQKSAFVTTPNGSYSGIWMGGTGIAADNLSGNARLFVATGNGSYDATTPYGLNTMDYGDDIVRLDVASTGALAVGDVFTPYNQASLASTDSDLGSGGVLIPPDQTGSYPHILLQAGKGGSLYVVNRDSMGGYNTTDKVLQEVTIGDFRQSPTYWNGNVYVWPSNGRLSRYTLAGGVLSSAAADVSPQSQNAEFGSRAIVSANGTSAGIAWAVDYSATTQVLYAYDATNLANLLWSSAQNATRDSAGTQQKFSIPVVADGRVFVASVDTVNVYGVLPADFTMTTGSSAVALQPGGTATLQVSTTALYGFSSALSLAVSGLPSGVSASVAAGSATNSFVVTFTATASAAVTSGVPVTLQASGGGVTHSATVTLTVGATVGKSPLFGTGSSSSVAFQDAAVAATPVTSIQVNAGSWLDHLQGITAKGAFAVHGGTGGSANTATLATNEYLVRIYGISSSKNVIAQLSFGTSSGRILGPYGKAADGGTHTSFDYTVPTGNAILGFYGKADSYLDAVGVLYGTAPASVSVPSIVVAAPSFTLHGIGSVGTAVTGGGLDGGSYVYNSALLGSSASFNGISFPFGPANGLSAIANATISLPTAGASYGTLSILGAAVNGPKTTQSFVVGYSDGTSSTFTQSLSDWAYPASYSGETVVVKMASRLNGKGAVATPAVNLYGYSFTLTAGKVPVSLKLPANSGVVVLGVALKK